MLNGLPGSNPSFGGHRGQLNLQGNGKTVIKSGNGGNIGELNILDDNGNPVKTFKNFGSAQPGNYTVVTPEGSLQIRATGSGDILMFKDGKPIEEQNESLLGKIKRWLFGS